MRLDVYGIILMIWFNMFWYQEWMEFSHSWALNVFPWMESSSFDIRRERHITPLICCRFSTNWIFVWNTGSFQIQSLWKRPIHFNTVVFLTSHTYQSYNRCDTMSLKSIPKDKDTSLFSNSSHFLLNVFSPSISLFHLNTSVNCMHFLYFLFFVWCYVIVLSLNFLSFLHCNFNTSLFDFFFYIIFRSLIWLYHWSVPKL